MRRTRGSEPDHFDRSSVRAAPAAPLLRSDAMSRQQRAPQSRGGSKRPSTRAASSPAPSGAHIGPVRITPLRVTLAIALIGGLAFLAYSVFVRDANQVLMMATGLFVVGVVFGVVAIMSVGRIITAGREGRDAAAVFTALLGGLFAMGSLLLLAGAVILALIWNGTKTG